jgi:hypothetical protein
MEITDKVPKKICYCSVTSKEFITGLKKYSTMDYENLSKILVFLRSITAFAEEYM